MFLAVCAFAVAAAAATYTNPVLNQDTPDPGVVLANGTWYAATTGGAPGGNYFPIHTSADLVTWAPSGYAFNASTWPKWADGTSWAPEVHRIPATNAYVIYYVSRLAATGALCIGAAKSLSGSPLGPFVDRGSPLQLAPAGSCFGVIDPTFYYDEATRTPYLVYKEDGNSCGKRTRILAVALDDDGLSVAAGITPTQLIVNDPATWEEGVVEAPWLMRNGSNGALFLFYSGATYDQPSYALGVARSPTGSPLGPFTKYAANPVMRSAPGAGKAGSGLHYGPGHCSVVDAGAAAGGASQWAFVYAAMAPGGQSGRNLMLDAVAVTADGWPVGAHGGVPSNGPEPVPGQPAAMYRDGAGRG